MLVQVDDLHCRISSVACQGFHVWVMTRAEIGVLVSVFDKETIDISLCRHL